MSDVMGSLAATDEYDPFAAEKFVNPAVQNTMGALLAPRVRDENSPVEYTTASPLVNITTQDIADATDKAMAFSGGGLGIKAYHSSPHDFDRFDLSKIGTGEGAQVYGHGLYFAENPAVSGQGGQYWKQFQGHFSGPEANAADLLQASKFDRKRALEIVTGEIERDAARGKKLYNPTELEHLLEQQRLLASGKPVGPRTYEVNINADPAHFLDWDKKLSQQPAQENILQAMKARGLPLDETGRPLWAKSDPTGEAIEASLAGAKNRRYASDVMNEAGIPGIKYLDQGSRPGPARFGALFPDPSPTPTSNYVVFNPNIIDIRKKYGLAGAIGAGGMGALAAQDQYSNGGL